MVIEYSEVTCAEVHGTVIETVTAEGLQAKVVLRCAAADKNALVIDLLTSGASSPRPWPKPAVSTPFVASITVKPSPTDYDTDGQGIAYKYYDVAVTYEETSSAAWPTDTIEDMPPEDDVARNEEYFQPGAQYLKLPNRYFTWMPDPDAAPKQIPDVLDANSAPGLMVRGGILTRTNFRQKYFPVLYTHREDEYPYYDPLAPPDPDPGYPEWRLDPITEIPTTCNKYPYTTSVMKYWDWTQNPGSEETYLTFEAETLLAEGPIIQPNFTEQKGLLWDITYRFSYNPHTWNRFYRPDTATWEHTWVAKDIDQQWDDRKPNKIYLPSDYRQILFSSEQTYEVLP